ncbi:hypothetical protein O3M35_005837 [Rhynocoris fuscipes]|uniref:Endonuclease/exonuclease/phosphatase family domain-containing protein 1 n=1 Tax=Rhynocoris fuscipes TaxID=488301 RepID=A0AAW1DK14_9HEMI
MPFKITMGQTHSMPSSRKRHSRRSFRTPFTRNNTHGSLSATFNYFEPDLKVNQLNINHATEEELMTLPGVTRRIARNIVEYRQAIGGRFNKVEDLALVSGIGADRLDDIRPEICITRRKVHSCTSSRTQSLDSVKSNDLSPVSVRTPLDVNKANAFQLMTIRGINQELAASIVDYRQRRGDFFTLDDLLKVKGMSTVRLSSLRPKLTVKSEPIIERKAAIKQETSINSIPNGKPAGISEKISCNGSVGAVKDVYELVSAYCHRPTTVIKEIPQKDFRLASWNLTDMCREKAENNAVREVFCLTLLENRISFVALQGIQDSCSLRMLCDEFKIPLCKRVKEWKGSRGNWVFQFVPMQSAGEASNLGFIYNAQLLRHVLVKVVQDNSMMHAAEANITFCGSTINVLNVHLMSNSCESSFATLLETINPAIILGDFSLLKNCDKSSPACYKPLLSTNTSTKSASYVQKSCYDNIFFKESSLSHYAGENGVIRNGLNHLAIPKGWNWNGVVSDHCPVWAQLTI